MVSVTFPTGIGGDGSTYTDDASPTTGLANGGHRARLVPLLAQLVAVSQTAANNSQTAQQSATTAVNAPGTAATSTTSLAIGTGSKTLTIQTGKSIVVGMTVKIAYTTTPTIWMAGDVTAYNAATGALTVNVTLINGTGTFAAWTVSLSSPALPGVLKTGDTMSGALNDAPAVTLASAATVDIGAAASNNVTITGTTTITALGTIAAGAVRRVVFSGALTLTHNATSLILPGAANILTAAGDVAEFLSLGSGNWRCTLYQRADGTPIAGLFRSARSANIQLTVADEGKLIDITSGTFTQTFAAVATLGSGWYCWLRNSGSGDITLSPSNVELIDGLASYVMYPGETRLVQCDGSRFYSIVLTGFIRTFTASGSFIRPPGYSTFSGLLWGAGASGALGASLNGGAGGGGGGACVPFTIPASFFPYGSGLTVTIGAGGPASTSSVGNPGGDSSLGSLVTAYGGGPPGIYPSGGGGRLGKGSNDYGGLPAMPSGMYGSAFRDGVGYSFSFEEGGGTPKHPNNGNLIGMQPVYGGGAGAPYDGVGYSHNSVFGGAGGGTIGGGVVRSTGTTVFGGYGGGALTGTPGGPGGPRGGGGGGSISGSSGAGGRGELLIWGNA